MNKIHSNYIQKTGLPALALAGLLTFTGCDKRLDIQPAQSIDQENALLTSSDVQATLVGAYALLGDQEVYGGRLQAGAELLANTGDLQWSGTYQGFTQIYNKAIPNNNLFVEQTWVSAYAAINTANNVLSALDKVDAAARDRVEGEAKFIRGLMYFDLARLYARPWGDGDPNTVLGVPLVTTPTRGVDQTSSVSRATLAATFDQVIADLTDAAQKLPKPNSFYANRYSAFGILSRVYLWQARYPLAATAADSVISSGEFELVENFADAFPYPGQVRVDNTPEDVFAIQLSAQSGFNGLNELFASADDGGRGDIQISVSHLAKYQPDDERLTLFTDDAGSTRTGKHSNLYGNVKVLRLAELYLTRAEANLRAGTTIGATPLEDVNTVRERANLAPLTGDQLTLAAILRERELELAFEGQYLFDVKRTRRSIGSLPWNSPKLIYPIPLREIIANPGLNGQQNDGY